MRLQLGDEVRVRYSCPELWLAGRTGHIINISTNCEYHEVRFTDNKTNGSVFEIDERYLLVRGD